MAFRRGFKWNETNSRLDLFVNGTRVAEFDDAASYLTVINGITVDTGDLTVTAGDAHVVAENLYMGAETAFLTTEPTSAVILKEGTAPSGAIVTSNGIYSSATVLRKVIADGTLSNVET